MWAEEYLVTVVNSQTLVSTALQSQSSQGCVHAFKWTTVQFTLIVHYRTCTKSCPFTNEEISMRARSLHPPEEWAKVYYRWSVQTCPDHAAGPNPAVLTLMSKGKGMRGPLKLPRKASICFWIPVCIQKSNIRSTYSSALSIVTICKGRFGSIGSFQLFTQEALSEPNNCTRSKSYLIFPAWLEIHSCEAIYSWRRAELEI